MHPKQCELDEYRRIGAAIATGGSKDYRRCNGAAYNAYQGSLPQVMFAKSIGFEPAPYYETNEEGLDVLPDFKTDDGELFKQGFATLKTKAGSAAKAVDVANQKIEEVRQSGTDDAPSSEGDEPVS